MSASNTAITFMVTALLSSATFALDCVAPKTPDIPKGNDTGSSEMMEARAEFGEYLAQSRQYLTCLKEEQMKLAKDATRDERKAVSDMYDTMARNMEKAYKRMGRAADQFQKNAAAKMDDVDAATQSEQDAVSDLYNDMVTKLKAASNEVKRAYNDYQSDIEEAG